MDIRYWQTLRANEWQHLVPEQWDTFEVRPPKTRVYANIDHVYEPHWPETPSLTYEGKTSSAQSIYGIKKRGIVRASPVVRYDLPIYVDGVQAVEVLQRLYGLTGPPTCPTGSFGVAPAA